MSAILFGSKGADSAVLPSRPGPRYTNLVP